MLYINEYIERQTIENQSILYLLRDVILNFDDEVEEKFKYKIPYYHYRGKSFCYLNIKNDQVELGLINGNQMHDEFNILQNHHLKSIRHLQFNNIDETNLKYVPIYLEKGKVLLDKLLDK